MPRTSTKPLKKISRENKKLLKRNTEKKRKMIEGIEAVVVEVAEEVEGETEDTATIHQIEKKRLRRPQVDTSVRSSE